MRRREFMRAVAAGTIVALAPPAQARPRRMGMRQAARALTYDQVIANMRLVNRYWIDHNPPGTGNNDWAWATYHSGNMAMYELLSERALHDYSLAWARRHGFSIRRDERRPFFADHHCAGQVYLDLYRVNPLPERLTAISDEIEAMIATGKATYWTWVDALHMAMPVFARLGVLYGAQAHLDRMDELYTWTRTQAGGQGLLDQSRGLWWRDERYIRTNTYWSRGNGWAIAALVKVLDALPADDPRRPAYIQDVRAMAAALAPIQRPDGFWAANLGNPDEFPAPETSGTAFFTYGLAWAINRGMLDAAAYRPVVEQGWHAMVTTAVHSDGFLGYVQGPAGDPSAHQPVTYDDTSQFGVGAFLLAGSEVAMLVGRCSHGSGSRA